MSGVTHDGARWSNAEDDRIVLAPYDAGWPARFEAEAVPVAAALAPSGLGAFQLEHVGSTAIPGLAAKPIIDILVLADDRRAGRTPSRRWRGSATCTGRTTRGGTGCSS